MPCLYSSICCHSTLGSVIFILPLESTVCDRLTADFAKLRSNDFNRLGEKCANRRIQDRRCRTVLHVCLPRLIYVVEHPFQVLGDVCSVLSRLSKGHGDNRLAERNQI